MDKFQRELRLLTIGMEAARIIAATRREYMASITGFDISATLFRERREKLVNRMSIAHDRIHKAFTNCDSLADRFEDVAIQVEKEASAMEGELKRLTNFSDNAAGTVVTTDTEKKSGGM